MSEEGCPGLEQVDDNIRCDYFDNRPSRDDRATLEPCSKTSPPADTISLRCECNIIGKNENIDC